MTDDNGDPAEREAFLSDARKPTDRECLIQLIESLGLKEGDARAFGDAYEDYETEIRIAFGKGTPCAEFRVQFDLGGKAISHAVYDLSPESR